MGNAPEVIRDAIGRMQAEESRVSAWQAAIVKAMRNLIGAKANPIRRN